MITIFQAVIFGLIQGVAEWLPISSEAMVNIVAINVFQIDDGLALQLGLMLHIGTVLSAIIYFRPTIVELLKNPKGHVFEWQFLSITTIVSLFLGGGIYLYLADLAENSSGGAWLTLLMGVALLVTAWLLSRSNDGLRSKEDVSHVDGLVLGVTQGLALIPGISRSGSTTALLLWRKFDAKIALELSFIMGIPLICIGAVLLMATEPTAVDFALSIPGVVALVTTFISGLVTITFLMTLAKKVNFSKFVGIIGIVTILAGILSL